MIFINKISQIKYKINIDIIELFHIINIKKIILIIPFNLQRKLFTVFYIIQYK